MPTNITLRKFQNHLRTFSAARTGNVVMTFALALVPIMGMVGAAIDYSRANSDKAAMQAAIDATGLMLSKTVTTLSTSEIPQQASAYFMALFNRPEVSNIAITPTYTSSGGSRINIKATGRVPTTILKIIGLSYMNIDASSEVKWGTSRLRVALVLDNTGSMATSNKLSALKSATKNLLSQLQSVVTNSGDVYVSIIPFAKDVNVDPIKYNETWVDWTDWEAEPPFVAQKKNSGWSSTQWNNWEKVAPGSTCPFTDTAYGFHCKDRPATLSGAANISSIPSSGTYKNLICPSMDTGSKTPTKISVYYNGCYDSTTYSQTGSSAKCPSTKEHKNCACSGSGSTKTCKTTSGYYYHPWRPVASADYTANTKGTPAHSTWNGCVVDRGDSTGPNSGNYDTNVVPPSPTNPATLLPAEQYDNCTQPIMPLSYNWASMTSVVDNMTANGNTNQAIGLASGWMSLVGGGPFPTPPAMDPNYKYSQVIILLTDGLNTEDRWYTSQGSIDARQQKTCDNINAAKITLYAIQVNTSGDPTSTLLQKCAGSPGKYPDPDKFFLLTSSNQIVTTFSQIGTELSKLRVAQ